MTLLLLRWSVLLKLSAFGSFDVRVRSADSVESEQRCSCDGRSGAVLLILLLKARDFLGVDVMRSVEFVSLHICQQDGFKRCG